MTFPINSVYGNKQNNRSLEFTASGGAMEEITFSVSPIPFLGLLIGSVWYKITNNPPTGEASIGVLEAGLNNVDFGWEYSGSNEATFFIELNASRFEVANVFNSNTDQDWLHVHFYIDWRVPANSVFFFRGVPLAFTLVPVADSTGFNPVDGSISLGNVVAGVQIAEIFLARTELTQADFLSKVVPLLSNNIYPFSLGHRGGLPISDRPWIYMSFQDKKGTGGLVNDANGSVLDFGTFTDFFINTTPNNVVHP